MCGCSAPSSGQGTALHREGIECADDADGSLDVARVLLHRGPGLAKLYVQFVLTAVLMLSVIYWIMAQEPLH